jgi:hypothetical protein
VSKSAIDRVQETINAHRDWVKTNGGNAPTQKTNIDDITPDENKERPQYTEQEKQEMRDKLEAMIKNNHGVLLMSVSQNEKEIAVNSHIMNVSDEEIGISFYSIVEDHPFVLVELMENLRRRKAA